MKHPLIILFRSMLVLLWFFPWEMLQARDIQIHSSEEHAVSNYDQLIDIGDDISSLVWDMDTIQKNVSSIHEKMEALSNDVNTYVNESSESCNWNRIGAIGSITSIVIMILVYLFTKKQTNKQILAQAENTRRQIEENRRLSGKQIKAIQEQSLSRIQSLEKMGGVIKSHTSEIQKTVKHFENKYLANNDGLIVENALSEMIESYERLLKKMDNDYYHFDNDSNNSKPNMDFYEEKSSKIKKSTEIIRGTLTKHKTTIQIPDEKPYLEALNEVVFKPTLLDMDEQMRNFSQKGIEYHNEVRSVMLSLFNEIL